MHSVSRRLAALARQPRRLPGAAVRRVLPRSPKYGFPWVPQSDGSITFYERGFVAASSPSALLARHNFEVARIHTELAGVAAIRSLEIGCGFGRLSPAIASHSDSHVAIDINPQALAAAKTTYPGIAFLEGSARSILFDDDYFDLVVTWTVLQHVRPEHISSACAEISRVLAPGGTLLSCEETRHPLSNEGHTWHRSVETYRELFPSRTLLRHGQIDEIARIPGMESPGTVMVFGNAVKPEHEAGVSACS